MKIVSLHKENNSTVEQDTQENVTNEQVQSQQPATQEQQTQQQNIQNNQQEVASQQNYQSQDFQSNQQTQQPVNSAREQALKEGIDFDNPTDEEIEEMRELSKTHHMDCKNLLKQDLTNNFQGSSPTLIIYFLR